MREAGGWADVEMQQVLTLPASCFGQKAGRVSSQRTQEAQVLCSPLKAVKVGLLFDQVSTR